MLQAMHPGLSPEDAASVVINHPNHYYELAQKASKGIALSSCGESGAAPQRTNGTKWCAVKVPLNDSQLANQSQPGLDDTTIDDEFSRIDSTLLDYSNVDF